VYNVDWPGTRLKLLGWNSEADDDQDVVVDKPHYQPGVIDDPPKPSPFI